MAVSLLNLPHEVLHCIFTHVDPGDLARLSCCKTLHAFVKGDTLLFKELYLKHFDDPRRGGEEGELWWEERLQKLVKLCKIFQSSDDDVRRTHIEFVQESIDYLLNTSPRAPSSLFFPWKNVAFLRDQFNDERTRALLTESSLFKWAAADAGRQRPSCKDRQEDNDDRAETATIDAQVSASEMEVEPIEDTNHIPPTTVETSLSPHTHDGLSGEPDMSDHHWPPLGLTPFPLQGREYSRLRQMSAKLHCLYGAPIQEAHRASTNTQRYSLRSDTVSLHPYARSRTYDMRQHTENTYWGPFFDDNTQAVDWEKVEAIMIILDHNMRQYAENHEISTSLAVPNWTKPFRGTSPYSYTSYKTKIPIEPPLPLEDQDPYNVTGTWMRVVCFLDYTELFDFNFAGNFPPANQPRPPLDTDEAIRLITMRLMVTKVEKPGREDGKALPVVWFKGESSSVRPSWDPNANSKIRGCVRLTPHGEVRWTSWSIFHGEERWKSEGIQVGGVQSARGVMGYWFDKDHDEHGPAGPTAFWKSHDGIEVKQTNRNEEVEAHELHALHMPTY